MEETVFVVNPNGGVHSVTKDHAKNLIAEGYRLANKKEIGAWYEMQGLEKPKTVELESGDKKVE